MNQNMFKFLIKTFYYETTTYIVNTPKETVIQQLDTLFTERSGLFKSPNLRGHFVEFPHSFAMTPKWSPFTIKSFESRAAYLKGVVEDTANGKSVIEIAVRPNSVFGIIFIAFAMCGIYNLIVAFMSIGTKNNLYGGLLLLIAGLPIEVGMARVTAGGLRSEFEKYLK